MRRLLLIVTALLSVAAGLTLLAPGGASAAGFGRACSEFFGPHCATGQFCDFGGGTCGAFDFGGMCAIVPRFCSHIYKPVCGCNGQTYGNDCTRQMAKVSKRHDGRC
jgi:Kazal-type serine protease inhibitor domain